MVLDNLATFASFVSQFTPINVLPCRKIHLMFVITMMIVMTLMNGVKRQKSIISFLWLGKCTCYITHDATCTRLTTINWDILWASCYHKCILQIWEPNKGNTRRFFFFFFQYAEIKQHIARFLSGQVVFAPSLRFFFCLLVEIESQQTFLRSMTGYGDHYLLNYKTDRRYPEG